MKDRTRIMTHNGIPMSRYVMMTHNGIYMSRYLIVCICLCVYMTLCAHDNACNFQDSR